MTGGPGCSSELAIFFENGPYTVTKKFLQKPELHDNPFSWNKNASVIYIDQPVSDWFGDFGSFLKKKKISSGWHRILDCPEQSRILH